MPRRDREKTTVTLYNDDDTETELPGKFEVCHSCSGSGTTTLHGIAITADEWHGPDWDDDSREMYMNGGYDTPCPTCKGKRVVVVIDETLCTPEQLANYRQQAEDDANDRAVQAAERRAELWAAGERD